MACRTTQMHTHVPESFQNFRYSDLQNNGSTKQNRNYCALGILKMSLLYLGALMKAELPWKSTFNVCIGNTLASFHLCYYLKQQIVHLSAILNAALKDGFYSKTEGVEGMSSPWSKCRPEFEYLTLRRRKIRKQCRDGVGDIFLLARRGSKHWNCKINEVS